MVDGQIHPDVIKKLWHVYSVNKEYRGAIIILGMIALAKKEVVTGTLEILLRIGLGILGKADLMLARYTWVALWRLSGSSKKFKGNIVETSRGHQASLQIPRMVRNGEQAIDTIYLLGEQPDVVANSLLQNFALRMLGKKQSAPAEDGTSSDGDVQLQVNGDPPSAAKTEHTTATVPVATDMGDSFQLSQLFVVGHVAIKHVVYLELVQRDPKRRNDVLEIESRRSARQAHVGGALAPPLSYTVL
ncbi:Condensin complex subunit [Tulasnella sp. 418]|nr:Condensin complex subunit [Tulasnella sp. 418]